MNCKSAAPIALFDSGVGGIGVLREVKKLLPQEQFLYFGDTANAPYGEKSHDEVRRLVFSAANRLIPQCKALVLACNTATAVAAKELRQQYPAVPIVGMEPALRPACMVKEHPTILVLATAATLQEEKFAVLREMCEKNATVVSLPAPGIVRLVEAGLSDSPEMDRYLFDLLVPFRHAPPDAVVLGCTHFPFARAAILRALGQNVPLFDGAVGTAHRLESLLREQKLLAPPKATGGILLTASDTRSLPLLSKLLVAP